jgi:hypothetical protein
MYLALSRKAAQHGVKYRAWLSITDAMYRDDGDPVIHCLGS